MPQSKTKRKARSSSGRSMTWGGPSGARDRRWNFAILAGIVLAALYGAYAWWDSDRIAKAFMARAAEGEGVLERVESIPSQGRAHLDPGQPYTYQDRFPTSGPHDPTWTPPGVHRQPQRPTQLVHALEHGNIVIYYDEPGPGAMERLEGWADLYDGQWSGLLVTPAAGLAEAVVLTAWTKRLELDSFDPAAAAAFIDAYRGRGPENPVR
jgi:hypothetical protein